MTRTMILLTLVAAAALAGCQENDPIVIGSDGQEVANTPISSTPVELPPSIAASKKYRCQGNGIVTIDWLSDNKSANLRSEGDDSIVQLTAPEPGQPLTAEGGYSLTGTAAASSISLTRPGQGASNCKA
ncbi:MAG: hypothetical protein H0X53_07055 [Sphingomonas sp.]|nr:hypothetical protein [Sphingomonas sp.]